MSVEDDRRATMSHLHGTLSLLSFVRCCSHTANKHCGCSPSVIRPSLSLMPVLGTVYRNVSHLHPVSVFQGRLKAFLFRHSCP